MTLMEKDFLSLLANAGGSVSNQTSSTADSCLDNAIFMEWRSFLDGWCCETSPAPLGWLLGGSRLLLYSLDKTVQNLLAVRNPHQSWEKQIPAHRRKRPLTTPTHRSEAAGETANVHQDRSPPPRPAGQAGSDLAAGPRDRATRHSAALASGALSLVLEAQIQGRFSQAQGRLRNHRASSGRWPRTIGFGAQSVFVENC